MHPSFTSVYYLKINKFVKMHFLKNIAISLDIIAEDTRQRIFIRR